MPAACGEEYHAPIGRSVTLRRGGFRGYFSRELHEPARRFMTHLDRLRPSIDALRMVYSITSVARDHRKAE